MSEKATIIKRVKDYRKYDPSMKRDVARRYLAGEFSYLYPAQHALPGDGLARMSLNKIEIATPIAVENPADALRSTT